MDWNSDAIGVDNLWWSNHTQVVDGIIADEVWTYFWNKSVPCVIQSNLVGVTIPTFEVTMYCAGSC